MKKLDEVVRTLSQARQELCSPIMRDERFWAAPGGKSHHHQYTGGLAEHTFEVASVAASMMDSEDLREQAIVAAVFHDYGKIHEYKFAEDGEIVGLPFRDLIGHVVWGWNFFLKTAEGKESQEWIDEVGHALLAHHGRLEWRSPVTPQTKLAFILHSADMLSAR